LWTSGGTLLAEAAFPTGTPAGWQEVTLAEPVPIAADTTYLVSYFTSSGYAASRPYFTEANRSAYERPPLRALVDGEESGNGVYVYGSASAFPNLSYQSSNYWADLVFVTSIGPVIDTTPPTVVSTIPAGGASGADPETSISAIFSEPVNATYLDGAVFELRDAGGVLAPATVAYDAATLTATLDPIGVLAYNSPYTATIKGGAYGVQDLSGNVMAADFVWSFTTAAEPPVLDHFGFATIVSPQTAGLPFTVAVTAYDQNGVVFSGFSGTAALSVSAGSIQPLQTGAFSAGVWSGYVVVSNNEALTGVVISATTGTVTSSSAGFDVQLLPAGPPFYTLTSPAYSYLTGEVFPVTVQAYAGAQINLGDDNHQLPVLVPSSNVPLLENATDGLWTEFTHTSRPYPSIMAPHNEYENNVGLPLMRFYASGIPDGPYEVIANLYDNAQMRYFYGFTPDDPLAHSVVVRGGATGYQHTEYSLGTVNIVGGVFNLYVQDADLVSGTYPVFGWAWVRLAPVKTGIRFSTADDAHQSPVLVTTTNAGLLTNDGQWTEFLYTSSRPYASVMGDVNEALPMMRFFTDGVPSGTYDVFANLYDTNSIRYYYGFTADAPDSQSVVTQGGFVTGEQHREYPLGRVTVTDGTFSLYVQNADLVSGTYPVFGWAHIRLSPAGLALSSSSPGMQFDGDGDGIFGEPEDASSVLLNNTFTINARGMSAGDGITITAAD
ncbi:MAG: DUF4082 domain-containing protein, partial [Chloroflexi bacterium]